MHIETLRQLIRELADEVRQPGRTRYRLEVASALAMRWEMFDQALGKPLGFCDEGEWHDLTCECDSPHELRVMAPSGDT